jgi:hypothetical protein
MMLKRLRRIILVAAGCYFHDFQMFLFRKIGGVNMTCKWS